MGIVRKMKYGYHVIEVLDMPGYYLVDKVPVLTGSLQLELITEAQRTCLFHAAENIWQPHLTVILADGTYHPSVYGNAFDDTFWDDHTRIDGAMVHYNHDNLDIHDPAARKAISDMVRSVQHSGLAVWIQNGELFGNTVPFQQWSEEICRVFNSADGGTSWRV